MIEFNKRNARTWSRMGLMGAMSAVGIVEEAKSRPDIYLLSADTSGLDRFKQAFPDRYYNVGIAEQNLIGVSAGIASEGNCVFATAYATFITCRAYEYVRHNLGYLQSNVKLLGFGSGVSVGTAGISHWSVDDLAIMRVIPGMMVFSPADAMEAMKMVHSVAQTDQPAYIKIAGGKDSPIIHQEDFDFEIGKAILLRKGTDVAIVATGLLVKESLDAADLLAERGISCTVADMHTIKPLDGECLEQLYQRHGLIVTVEEHSVIGGLGGAVAEHKSAYDGTPRLLRLGITDEFKESGTRNYILRQYGLTAEGIARSIQRCWDEH